MATKLIDLLKEEKLYPIIRCADPQKTKDTAKALIDGGVKMLEITLESPEIYDAIQEISQEAIVCAGGVITAQQATNAIQHGAKIISSPIFQMNMVKISKNAQIPFIAGTSTANEAYQAWKARVPLIKIYPITALGGPLYVEDLLRPMPFLNIMPMGNIKLEDVPEYIKAGATAVGVGRNLYQGFNFSEITNRTKNIMKELKG